MTAAAGDTATARVPVAHRLYSNAPGGDGGAGFRHLRIGDLADGARVESWLESLRPAKEGGLAWGGAAFRLGGALHLAVARVDGAFRPDEHGRGRGHLAHAIVAAAGEGEPDRDLVAELVEAAERLARPAGESGELETMLGGCASLVSVDRRATDRWWRQAAAVAGQRESTAAAESPAAGPLLTAGGDSALERGALPAGAAWLAPAVLAASAENAGEAIEVSWASGEATPGASTATASASARASAAAVDHPGATPASAAGAVTAAARAVAASLRALPPRLRLALRWSVAARALPGDRLRIALAPALAPSPPALAGPAAAYAEWLRDRLAAGDGAAVAAVAGDWQIRSWRHLVERLGAAVAR